MTGHRLLLRDVEVGGPIVDVRVVDGLVDAVGPDLALASDTEVVDGVGGALIPGLHDHHIHLLATAAAITSVRVGPPEVQDRRDLAEALRRAQPAGGWLRAVGYHERVAGDLDRHDLDALVADRPVRVQHRSGARWTLNSAAVDVLGLSSHGHPGIERDHDGAPTGRVHRADDLLRELLPPAAPDLSAVGRALVAVGVTGVTDCTPSNRCGDFDFLVDAVASGALPQRVQVTGGPALAETTVPAALERGPVKLIVDDGDYPALDELAGQMARAHDHDRSVAVHCVTRTALVLALAAWDVAGSRPGDRVEHGSVVPHELLDPMRQHGLTVVTQPSFIAERGDEYLVDVGDDLDDLYPCRRLLEAGVPVAGSTDAPFTTPDPWRAMRAAVSRTSPAGVVLGPDEVISPARALALFLGDLDNPGGPARTVRPGVRADLCLLAHPMTTILERLTTDDVRATICAGRVVYQRA